MDISIIGAMSDLPHALASGQLKPIVAERWKPEISNPNFYTFVWGAFLSHFMRHRSSRALETRSPRIRIEFFDLVDNQACHIVPLLADLDPRMPSVNSQRTSGSRQSLFARVALP